MKMLNKIQTIVIILNYNDGVNTIRLVNQIKNYNAVSKILIVDNASLDDSLFQIRERFSEEKKVVILNQQVNLGYSRGNQVGLDFIKRNFPNCEYGIISNPDIYFAEDFIISVASEFKKNPDYLILSGLMKDDENEFSKFAYWRKTRFSDDMKSLFYVTRKQSFNKYLKSNSIIGDIINVDVIPGSLYMIYLPRLEFEIFDQEVFLYYEEDIMSHKVRSKGLQLGIVKNTYFTHYHKPTRKKVGNYKYQISSMLKYQKKYNKLGLLKYSLLIFSSILSIIENMLMNAVDSLIEVIRNGKER